MVLINIVYNERQVLRCNRTAITRIIRCPSTELNHAPDNDTSFRIERNITILIVITFPFIPFQFLYYH